MRKLKNSKFSIISTSYRTAPPSNAATTDLEMAIRVTIVKKIVTGCLFCNVAFQEILLPSPLSKLKINRKNRRYIEKSYEIKSNKNLNQL